jgi:transposase
MGLSLLKAKLTLVPGELIVRQVMTNVEHIMIRADPPGLSAPCPVCHQRSHRIHSRYVRTLADLPSQGQAVTIALSVQWFRCDNTACTRIIFAERLADVIMARGRRSRRLADIQRHIGLALGGAAGGRLACRLALPVSGDTLLRLVGGSGPLVSRRSLPLSASTASRGSVVTAMAPSSATWLADASSTSCPIDTRPQWKPGWRPIRGSMSSPVIEVPATAAQ